MKARQICSRSTLTHTEFERVASDNLITLQPETKQIIPFLILLTKNIERTIGTEIKKHMFFYEHT